MEGIIFTWTEIAVAVVLIAGIMREKNNLKLKNRELEKVKSDNQILIRDSENKDYEIEKIKKQLEQSRLENRNFMSEISHELRIPISIIKGYADILSEGLVDDESLRAEYLAKICSKTELLNHMVTGLLKSGGVEKSQEAANQRINLKKLIETIAEYHSLKLQGKNINIFINLDEHEIFICADPIKISQIFGNLIDNCFKYMNRAGTITITAFKVNSNEVLIVVRDDGEGMDYKAVESVFDRNFQAANHKHINGEGLGLYIVKEIVIKSGGKIWAKSEFGKGMAIFIIIPLCE